MEFESGDEGLYSCISKLEFQRLPVFFFPCHNMCSGFCCFTLQEGYDVQYKPLGLCVPPDGFKKRHPCCVSRCPRPRLARVSPTVPTLYLTLLRMWFFPILARLHSSTGPLLTSSLFVPNIFCSRLSNPAIRQCRCRWALERSKRGRESTV